ncbi:MAG TPA: hypothetical protein VHM00_08770 [Caldimonas sp.]|nr:hypothetical protein [Caldimonas sp.]HEX2541161.1 hypothetical protein [Caldimonas sp.]
MRLAYVYVAEHGAAAARQHMRQALLGFLAAHRIPEGKFHETLTSSWVQAVSHFMDRSSSSSFAEFAAKSQPLLDSKIMLTHYSAQTLFSAEARASYVEPDLQAIPPKPGDASNPPDNVV